MKYYQDFLVNGHPILVPDSQVELSFQDLDSGSAGRDESGYMHRIRVRRRVATWGFSYFALRREDYHYMETLLAENPVFTFTYPGSDGAAKTCQAYCAKTGLTWEDAALGLYRNYKFSIIQC